MDPREELEQITQQLREIRGARAPRLSPAQEQMLQNQQYSAQMRAQPGAFRTPASNAAAKRMGPQIPAGMMSRGGTGSAPALPDFNAMDAVAPRRSSARPAPAVPMMGGTGGGGGSDLGSLYAPVLGRRVEERKDREYQEGLQESLDFRERRSQVRTSEAQAKAAEAQAKAIEPPKMAAAIAFNGAFYVDGKEFEDKAQAEAEASRINAQRQEEYQQRATDPGVSRALIEQATARARAEAELEAARLRASGEQVPASVQNTIKQDELNRGNRAWALQQGELASLTRQAEIIGLSLANGSTSFTAQQYTDALKAASDKRGELLTESRQAILRGNAMTLEQFAATYEAELEESGDDSVPDDPAEREMFLKGAYDTYLEDILR